MQGPDQSAQPEDAGDRSPLRVVVVEPHRVVRAGLRAQLTEAGMQVVGESDAVSPAAVEALIDALGAVGRRPDLVLVDADRDAEAAGEVARVLGHRHAEVGVVATSWLPDRGSALALLRLGVRGCVLKDASPTQLGHALAAAAQGDVVLTSHIADTVYVEEPEDPFRELTTREREVLAYLGLGEANKAIARRLGVSERTVRGHVSHILRKLNVSSRTQAALLVREHGAPRNR